MQFTASGGFISLGSGNDNITFSGAGVTNTTIVGTENQTLLRLLLDETGRV